MARVHRLGAPPRRHRYLLGDSPAESARLRAQARLWDPEACALFDRLGVRRGWRVLEVGPGQGSLHLELRRRVRGPVDAVEPSPAFRARLTARCARDGLGAGRMFPSELGVAALPRGHYDLVFARWVFLFVRDPGVQVRRLASALKPGGLLAIQDYHRESFVLVPRPPRWADFLAAERAFFAEQGADPSVGGRLPEWFRAAGLEVIEIEPTVKIGRPGSAVWRWLTRYFLGVMDRYARKPPLSPRRARDLVRRWHAAERARTSLMIAPTVLGVVGRRPRTPARRAPQNS